MNKRLLALAVAGAFAASGSVFAVEGHNGMMDKDGMDGHGKGAMVHGHLFGDWTLTDDFAENSGTDADGDPANANEGDFHYDAEVNFKAMVGYTRAGYIRTDLDYNNPYVSDIDPTNDNEVAVEQMFGAWNVNDMVKLKFGRFNNPVGNEEHDQADLDTFISHSLNRTHIWNEQIRVGDGNNLEGAAAKVMAGPAKLTVGLLNELQDNDEANSILLNAEGSPIPGLNIGLGAVTQEDFDTATNPLSAETLINFNADYGCDEEDSPLPWRVSFDYITAGEIYDAGYSIAGTIDPVENFGLGLRYDLVEYANDDEDTAITVAGSWSAYNKMDLRLEWRNEENDVGGTTNDGDTIKFGIAYLF